MSRLIDSEGFEVVRGYVPDGLDVYSYLLGNLEILQMIDNAPTIDAEPIVRCKDCTKHTAPLFPHPEFVFCTELEKHRKPDWFCKDGREKDDDRK